jgi:hypothetical protein
MRIDRLVFIVIGLSSAACLDDRSGRASVETNDETVVTSDANQGFLDIVVSTQSTVALTDICFTIAVENGEGELVWSRPGLCSAAIGNAAGGDITYIGTCDAESGRATVSLRIDSITTVDPGVQLQNPCPGPDKVCTLEASCSENLDTWVEFNLNLTH